MNKVFCILLFFFAVAFCAQNNIMNKNGVRTTMAERAEKYIRFCARESKGPVNFEDLKKHFYEAGTLFNRPKTRTIVEPAMDVKCAIKCVLHKFGILDQYYNYNREALRNVPHIVRMQTKACISEISIITNHCQKAYEIVKCYNKSFLDWKKKLVKMKTVPNPAPQPLRFRPPVHHPLL